MNDACPTNEELLRRKAQKPKESLYAPPIIIMIVHAKSKTLKVSHHNSRTLQQNCLT
jgi:hypothetical protein